MKFGLTLLQNRLIRWSVTILWTVFISILLVQPEKQPLIDIGIQPAPITLEREILFTTLHLIAFAITCVLWFWAWFGHLNLSKSLILAIVISIILGTTTEYLQIYSPDRYPSLIDYLANCLGASLAGYVIWRKQEKLALLKK